MGAEASISSIVGQVQRLVDNNGGLLGIGCLIRYLSYMLTIPVSGSEKAGNQADGAQSRNRSRTGNRGTTGAFCRAKLKKPRQTVITRRHVPGSRIRKGDGTRPGGIGAKERIVRTLRHSLSPRLPLRIGAQLFDKPLLGIDVSFNLSCLSLPDRRYQT